MVVVKIELWPRGDESQARCFGTMEIELTGFEADSRGRARFGAYAYRILQWGTKRRTWRRGVVSGHDRVKCGPWDLVFRCLSRAVADRNPDVVERASA